MSLRVGGGRYGKREGWSVCVGMWRKSKDGDEGRLKDGDA